MDSDEFQVLGEATYSLINYFTFETFVFYLNKRYRR